MAFKIKRLRHPGAVRSRAQGKPRLNKRQGLRAYRTGKK